MGAALKPILCLDFDGVLHSYSSGWQGATVIPDPPVEGARDFLVEALQHFRVAVYSSRSHQDGGIGAMNDWCLRHFGWAVAEMLDWPREKPKAMVTLDDRGITFAGEWPVVSDLLAFRPWNADQRIAPAEETP